MLVRGEHGRDVVMWHEVECGPYVADLPLWEELAERAHGGPVLELGCGIGRVALHLGRSGRDVVGVDNDPDLVAELNRRAAAAEVPAEARRADVRSLSLGRRFPLVLAPMQLVHLLDGPGERASLLTGIRAHLEPGGQAALALVEMSPAEASELPPLPDVRELNGWVYSSLPLDRRVGDGELVIERLRQRVSPDGAFDERRHVIRLHAVDPERLESEGRSAGLRPGGRREIPPDELHVGSTVLLLEG